MFAFREQEKEFHQEIESLELQLTDAKKREARCILSAALLYVYSQGVYTLSAALLYVQSVALSRGR